MFFPEHEYTTSTKTEDELKRLTLEEGLSDTQRAYSILTKGQQLQKRAVYANLHRLLRDPRAFEVLFPVIVQLCSHYPLSEEVQQQEEDNQILAAKSLLRLIKDALPKPDALIQIYHLAAQILKIWSLPVLTEWVLTLEALLRTVDLPQVLAPVNRLILLLTDQSQPTVSRQTASRLIGVLAELLQNAIKGPLFDRARILCSDQDREVRLVMASEVMVRVCLSVSSDLIETYMLEKILELFYDKDYEVKCAGMKLFFTVAQKLSPEEQKNRCVKLFVDQLQSRNEESQLLMSRICGTVFSLPQLREHMNEKQLTQFLASYKEFAKHKNPEVRANFAYNFVGVFSISNSKFERFQDTFLSIANDPEELVVRQTISGFHEIVLLSETTEVLVQTFFKYLRCARVGVLEVLVERFAQIVSAFQKHVRLIEMRSQQQAQFGSASLELLGWLVSHSCRALQEGLLNGILQCHEAFPDLEQFLNAMMATVAKGSPQVRSLSARNIAKYLSNIGDLRRRDSAVRMMQDVYLRGESYWQRIAYIELVEAFGDYVSRRLFKQLELYSVLELAKDSVVNVRMRLIKYLPFLRKKIEPEDEDLLGLFQEAVQWLILKGNRSFQEVIHVTKELLLKEDDEEKLLIEDMVFMGKEDGLIEMDQKSRQLDLGQEKDEYDFTKTDFNEYLSKYRKKCPLSKTRAQIVRKDKQQSSSLFVKKTIDTDIIASGARSPQFEQVNKRQTKLKTPMMKSATDVKKQFKLPSIKKC